MKNRSVPEAFHPGHFIQLELEARGWKNVDLAEIMGVEPGVVSQLVKGKRKITAKTAQELADAFGSLPEEWMKMQALYELAMERLPSDQTRKRKARLWDLVPMREMINIGWILDSENIDFLEGQVMQFFSVNDLAELASDTPVKCVARKSTDYTSVTKEQLVWFQRVRNIATAIPVSSLYRPDSLEALYGELSLLFCDEQEIRHVPKVLDKHGIRFLIVEPIKGSKIDAVSFWLDKDSPAIALSMRYNRIDWFWFTLCHELAHIHSGDGKEGCSVILDTQLVGSDAQRTEDKPEQEKRADFLAENMLIDQRRLEGFIDRVSPIFSIQSIEGFARDNGVHPGIVVGQLHHKRKMSYRYGNKLLVQVKDIITQTAWTDGWGVQIES